MKREYVESREKEIKKLDMKKLPVFTGYILVCVIIGFFAGKLISGNWDVKGFSESLSGIMTYVCPAALVLLVTVSAAVFIPALSKLSAGAKAWDGEDEDYIEKIESGVSKVVETTNIVWVSLYTVFGIAAYLMAKADKPLILSVLSIVSFFLGIVEVMYLQHGALKLQQLINPEKSGSLFALDFSSKQEKQLDEAEKLIHYRAAYKAHRAVNMACVLCWLLAVLLQILFSCGVLPVLFVSVIWLTDVAVMGTQCRKLDRNGGNA